MDANDANDLSVHWSPSVVEFLHEKQTSKRRKGHNCGDIFGLRPMRVGGGTRSAADNRGLAGESSGGERGNWAGANEDVACVGAQDGGGDRIDADADRCDKADDFCLSSAEGKGDGDCGCDLSGGRLLESLLGTGRGGGRAMVEFDGGDRDYSK